MRRARTLIGACMVAAVGLFAASCDENPTQVTEVDEAAPAVTTPTATEEAAGTESPAPTPVFSSHFGSTNGDCLNELATGDTRFNNATCSANDVEIKVLEVLEVDGVPVPPGTTVTCTEGDELEVRLRAYFGLNATERYDIGYYLAEDGGDAKIGDCFHGFLTPLENGTADPTGLGGGADPNVYDGPYRNLEDDDAGDICGDAAEADEEIINDIPDPIAAIIRVPQLITITCEDDDDDGFVEIGTCTSWDNNDKETCESVDDAVPGTPSKCNCRPAPLPINVQRSATVIVNKDVEPEPDDGSLWTLTIASPSLGSDVTGDRGDGGSIQTDITWFRDDEPGANKATVTEAFASGGAGSGDFYTSTYSCNSTNDAHDISTTSGRSIPEFTNLVNNEVIECTFVNTRIPPPAVTVTKNANESFDRAWAWTLTKDVFKNGAVPPAEICSSYDGGSIDGVPQALQLGQDLTVCYEVVATRTGPTDTGHNVSGTINVTVGASSAPYLGSFTVSDEIDPGDIAATWVDCDGTAGAPYVNTKSNVGPGDSFSCTYSVDLTEPQADAATTNTATADVTWNTSDTDSQSGTAGVSFGDEDIDTETDETADVTDNWNSTGLFTLADDLAGSQTFVFDRNLTCPDYGDFVIPNDAFLLSIDGGYDLTDDADVPISCPRPPSGCVLTQGFWRTHSEYGPAPYAEGWEEVVGTSECPEPGGSPNGAGVGADVEFGADETGAFTIDSDMCYYEVMWDPGKGGNMWFKVAHQYIAAWLNVEAGGADPTLVADELAGAADLLAYYDQQGPGTLNKNSIPKQGTAFCDTQAASHPCKSYNSDRQYATFLNNTLTQYNEGTLPGGPEHCDDDAQSLATSP